MTSILGISAFYHDSGACLLRDGVLVAAAQEERFTRKKHDHNFPARAVEYCLQEAGIEATTWTRSCSTTSRCSSSRACWRPTRAYAPTGIRSFLKAMPLWLHKKLHIEKEIRKALDFEGKVLYTGHHESHAASAFFPSPFEKAATLTIDGVGEWSTSTLGIGDGQPAQDPQGDPLPPLARPALLSAFTYYTGFRVNSGEYKVMGLAPYGEPKYADLIRDKLIDIREDGSFRLDMRYFNYCAGLTMTNRAFAKLFGAPPRKPETEITQREMDLARSVQVVTEEVMLKMAAYLHAETGLDNLCMAGGVALNCVGNGACCARAVQEHVDPAGGRRRGRRLGAAFTIWHHYLDKPRTRDRQGPADAGSYLGPAYSTEEIEDFVGAQGAGRTHRRRTGALADRVAGLIENGKVIGWFQGRMEFGPRALGARSILGDPRNREMQTTMNLKIKYRESFRPFAPIVLREHVADWFELDGDSPYMLLVAPVKESRRIATETDGLSGIDLLKQARSEIPAVTHVDYSARVQTVHDDTNPRLAQLMRAFFQKTGCPVLINTSFNVRGEPIVCTPEDAYTCFMRTEMDVLVLGNHVLLKPDQPALQEQGDWRKEFALD